MKTKALITIVAIGILLSFSQVLKSQELQAVVSGGAYHQSTSGSISWSLGEVTIQTLRKGDYIMTQGFQQSKLTVTSIDEIPGLDITISAYPNPTNDYINLKVDGEINNLKYSVYDINGRIVKSGEFKSNPNRISFYDLGAAIYFIRITQNNLEIKTLRVVKH